MYISFVLVLYSLIKFPHSTDSDDEADDDHEEDEAGVEKRDTIYRNL